MLIYMLIYYIVMSIFPVSLNQFFAGLNRFKPFEWQKQFFVG